jgi:hypothetical protein
LQNTLASCEIVADFRNLTPKQATEIEHAIVAARARQTSLKGSQDCSLRAKDLIFQNPPCFPLYQETLVYALFNVLLVAPL